MMRVRADGIEAVVAFLARTDVNALFALAARSALTPEALREVPLPAGLSFRQTEQLLYSVNHLFATKFPVPDADGLVYWYSSPKDMLRLVQMIDRHCSEDSYLNRTLTERSGGRFMAKSLIDEAIATGSIDGVDIRSHRARELLTLTKTPSNDGERVIVNAHRVLSDLPQLAEMDICAELLVKIYEQVIEGTQFAPFNGTELIGGPSNTLSRLSLLHRLCAVASDAERPEHEHPAITSLMLQWALLYWNPFPAQNGAMARILMKLHALKNHYPVLGFLPISSTRQGWRLTESMRMSGPPHAGEQDMTGELMEHLEYIRDAINAFLTDIEVVYARDAALEGLLKTDPALNPRQRSILGRALRVPDATFRIRYHQTTNAIAYSTARTDLLELEAKGFLRQQTEGRAFVFVAVENLADMIDYRALPAAAHVREP